MNVLPSELTEDQRLVLAFWGKAHPQTGDGAAFHPCFYHSLDVAAVGEALLFSRPDLLAWLASAFGWSEEEVRRAALFLLAVHDIGKLSRTFQALVPELWPNQALGPYEPVSRLPRHDAVAWLHLDASTLSRVPPFEGWRPSAIRALLAPFIGHHGRPVEKPDTASVTVLDSGCKAAAVAMIDIVRELFEPPSVPQPRRERLARASWRLAGLAVLSDWIGSNQCWFPYHAPVLDARRYLEQVARPRARTALAQAGTEPARSAQGCGFAALIDPGFTPSAVQHWAETVTLGDGPCLAVIEDITGSGKTEAALVLAHRLMAEGRAHGLYVALPTMATANAMYARLAESYRRLFQPDERPSLALAHGRATLHEGFQANVLPIENPIRAGEAEDEAERDASGAACAAWLADSRRKAFLADVGVGTIDQAFLAVLPAKYQSLRLFGLTDRVLIVDEAHAYDAYMHQELQALLGFHAALGGSAIVLSATLPDATRSTVAHAYAHGLGVERPSLCSTGYPRVAVVGRQAVAEDEPEPRPDLRRGLRVSRVDDPSAAVAHIREAAAAGAAVAWVRNTVDDALDALEALRAEGTDVELFHARFAMGDRLDVEGRVVDRFGPDGAAEDRPGVLVATQVIEQSLDLDFDLLVSDLAPIDLLLQRAGRLWRHGRGLRPVPGPELLVVGPAPVEDAAARWFAEAFPRAAHVYRNHALLWLSARHLFAEPEWRVPEDVRTLVEAVYGADEAKAFPPALERNFEWATGDDYAAIAQARVAVLKLEDGYCAGHIGWDEDTRVLTRLGEERRVLRLARVENGAVVPWCKAPTLAQAWALSEVEVHAHRAVGERNPPELRNAIETAKATWTRHEADKLLVVLAPEPPDHWCGGVASDGAVRTLLYSRSRGLRFG